MNLSKVPRQHNVEQKELVGFAVGGRRPLVSGPLLIKVQATALYWSSSGSGGGDGGEKSPSVNNNED